MNISPDIRARFLAKAQKLGAPGARLFFSKPPFLHEYGILSS